MPDAPTPNPSAITAYGMCRYCHTLRPLVAHGSMCQGCLDERESGGNWKHITPTIRVDIGTYGSDVDDEDIAYLLRMGGIDAEVVEGDDV